MSNKDAEASSERENGIQPRDSLEESVNDEAPVARVTIEEVDGDLRTRIILGSTKGATSFSSVFTLCNSCIGAGVLSLPYAFRRAGNLLEAIVSRLASSCFACYEIFLS